MLDALRTAITALNAAEENYHALVDPEGVNRRALHDVVRALAAAMEQADARLTALEAAVTVPRTPPIYPASLIGSEVPAPGTIAAAASASRVMTEPEKGLARQMVDGLEREKQLADIVFTAANTTARLDDHEARITKIEGLISIDLAAESTAETVDAKRKR